MARQDQGCEEGARNLFSDTSHQVLNQLTSKITDLNVKLEKSGNMSFGGVGLKVVLGELQGRRSSRALCKIRLARRSRR